MGSGKVRFIMPALIAVIGICPFLNSQQTPGLNTVKTVDINHEFIHPPQWSGGAYIADEGDASAVPVAVLFGRDGQEFSRIELRLTDVQKSVPNAERATIFGQARGADGTVVLSASAIINGKGEGKPFLAIFTNQGQLERIVRTASYLAREIVVTPDGDIWTSGHMSPMSNSASIFRHFDKTGELIGSFGPQASFRSVGTAGDPRNRLVSSTDRLAFLCPMEHRYIELSLNGSVIADVSITLPSATEQASGLALTAEGKILISTFDHKLHQSNVYILDAKSGGVSPVRYDGRLPYNGLSGVDGDLIVAEGGSNLAFYRLEQ